jgi:RNA-binding protein YlmH
MTALDKDNIIWLFENERNFSALDIMAKYGSRFSRDDVEAMLNELRMRIYVKILEQPSYEVDTAIRY